MVFLPAIPKGEGTTLNWCAICTHLSSSDHIGPPNCVNDWTWICLYFNHIVQSYYNTCPFWATVLNNKPLPYTTLI
jgi:hypothetical protein